MPLFYLQAVLASDRPSVYKSEYILPIFLVKSTLISFAVLFVRYKYPFGKLVYPDIPCMICMSLTLVFTNFFGKAVLIEGLPSPYLNRLIISVFTRHVFVFTNFFGKIDFGIFRRSFCLLVANILSINLFSLICPV